MLHAFSHGKSRLYKRYGTERYRGHREADEKRVGEEDEITALIMGPLDYLPAEANDAFWRALIGAPTGGRAALLPVEPATRVQMHFWPRRGIEPDLWVQMHWPGGEQRYLLVEFKWNAPLSGENQLHRQWTEFIKPAEREQAIHVFIGPEISAALNAVAKGDIWGERLVLRSWMNVLEVLHHLTGARTTGLERWSHQASAFLERLQVRRFQGFRDLVPPSALPGQAVFWNPLNGFAHLQPPDLPARDAHGTYCFRSSNHE